LANGFGCDVVGADPAVAFLEGPSMSSSLTPDAQAPRIRAIVRIKNKFRRRYKEYPDIWFNCIELDVIVVIF
jgi:hypothetical protein